MTVSCAAAAMPVKTPKPASQTRLYRGSLMDMPSSPSPTQVCVITIQPRRRPSEANSGGESLSTTAPQMNFTE